MPSSSPRNPSLETASAVLIASSAEGASHPDDVDAISDAICQRLGVSDEEREQIVTASRLHDIGKLAIPREVLEKSGPLAKEDWAAIHRHTMVGEEMVRGYPELEAAARIVRHTHEWWDGSGYPDGLAGEEIPLGSRIIACADAFHAIRRERPYRPALSPQAALAELRECAGTQFDPAVVEALDASSPRRGLRRLRRR